MPGEFAPLSRSPLTVRVAGHRYELPWRPAAEWAAATGRLTVLAATLMTSEDRDELADVVMDCPQAVDDLREESLRILAEAGGRAWWEVARLLATSTSPEVLGRLVLAGASAWDRSVGEWCAAVYALCVKGQDEKGRIKFDFTLSIPPAGYENQWDDGGSSDPMEFLASMKR